MKKYRVAIIGCGGLGQQYARAYLTYPDTELVAIAEINDARRKEAGESFGVKALYPDVHALLRDTVPDIAAIVTPTKYMKEAVIACAEAGVTGISTDKPIAAKLSDADEMVEACESRNIVYAGGNLQRAMNEVQEVSRRIHDNEYGKLIGASVHAYGKQISGGGCQQIAILQLFTGAEVCEVMTWGFPLELLSGDTDVGIYINGTFRLTNGVECTVFGEPTPYRGVEVWTEDTLIRWDWAPPEIYRGFHDDGSRIPVDPDYKGYPWSEFKYLTGSIRSFLQAVETGSELWISGRHLRQTLEVAIASKLSAQMGNVPVKLPLEDRSLYLVPSLHRWEGRDAVEKG